MKIKDKLSIGERIKLCRKQQGMTQAALALALGISPVNISQIETGRRSPTIDTVKVIADALGVSISDLTGEPIRLDFPMPDYPVRLPTKEEFEHMDPTEREYRYLRHLADTAPDQLKKQLTDGYDKLNKLGQVEAVRHIADLSGNPKYTEPDPNNTTRDPKEKRPRHKPRAYHR